MSTKSLKITEELLQPFNFKATGKTLVVKLLADHFQQGCKTVPAGTVGVVKAQVKGQVFFVFPHSVLKEKNQGV